MSLTPAGLCAPRTSGLDFFDETNLICGLEMLAAKTAAGPTLPIQGRCVTFYVDSKSALGAAVKADSKTAAISASARILCEICARRGITPRFEWATSGFNISGRPARFKHPLSGEFGRELQIYERTFPYGYNGNSGQR